MAVPGAIPKPGSKKAASPLTTRFFMPNSQRQSERFRPALLKPYIDLRVKIQTQ
jgi:hypothetical protein